MKLLTDELATYSAMKLFKCALFFFPFLTEIFIFTLRVKYNFFFFAFKMFAFLKEITCKALVVFKVDIFQVSDKFRIAFRKA